MLRLKKYVRNIIKTLFVLIFLGVLYTTQFHRIDSHHILREQEILFKKEKVPSDMVAENKKQIRENPVEKPLLDDVTFEERDMFDENGKPFQIAIWLRHSGKPGYLANPKECLGNISCDIIYASSSPVSAHAIVFNAGNRPRNSPAFR